MSPLPQTVAGRHAALRQPRPADVNAIGRDASRRAGAVPLL